ncbi:MAG: NAD(P)H-hydrate dehydratase [Desulfobacteraceae bacterium]|nr:MAG: NAD(P)H-hydrate dehydratase [Desulfobacteraceae bacterium]
MKLVTAQQMQNMDRNTIESFGIPGLVLMESAGRGAFDMMLDRYGGIREKTVCILAGRGNNGGDGFVIGRYLMEAGISTTMILLSSEPKVTGDARINLDLVKSLCRKNSSGRLIEVPDEAAFNTHKHLICHHDIFVDAILGTGLKSDVKGFFHGIIQMLNQMSQPVFSVDIPSGLNSDTGQPCGIAVQADATATFAFAKAGHILFPGNQHTGELRVIDIGIPGFIADQEGVSLSLMEKEKIAALFKPRRFDAHKGTFGHLMVVAGSAGKTGAATLCSNAAMKCGTGLVTLAVPESLYPPAGSLFPEIMAHILPEPEENGTFAGCFSSAHVDQLLEQAKTRTALAVGPGIGTGTATGRLVRELIRHSPCPVVLDADGLNCIADDTDLLKAAKSPLVLTPHPGEMARLIHGDTATVQENRLQTGQDFAVKHGVTLVLKGAQTLVCLPGGHVYICPCGNPGMASGGMGDVLTGLIAGFLAQGFTAEQAAKAGVFIHGRCADLLSESFGGFGFLASDIIEHIPDGIHSE